MRETRVFDIAVNPTYYKKDALDKIMDRATENEVTCLFIGCDMESSTKVLELCKEYKAVMCAGVHPNHIDKDEAESGLDNLSDFILSNREHVVAIGECGLDYCRSGNKMDQKRVFRRQLELYGMNVPYLFHQRDAFDDFYKMIRVYPGITGVVHSYTGTIKEAKKLVELGLYIGLNGCSLRQNTDLAAQLPIDRILVETDSPFCLIRKSYAASEYVSVRKAKENEPSFISDVIEVIAGVKRMSYESVQEAVKENTVRLLFKK
ncbi:TATD1 [Enterospora canceri]|uniref:TATD1 n=1 Tax=Enterospora canceri TaxID=1081671 RepID=A0A1Y1S6D2_9MICR|nr:TATD1 [Enterospora canceri]